jgi:hypothetical protein
MPHHRRIVLHLHHGAVSRDLLREAADMARLLGLGLFAVFVEDEAVHGLASLPFAREFRLPSHAWQPIDPEQLAADFRHAAGLTKRLLDDVARDCGVVCGFEVRRGDPSVEVAAVLRSNDIVVLAERADVLTDSFLRAWRSATGSNASVLLLPPGMTRRHGPVAVLAAAGARGVATGAHIARIARETLIVLGDEAGRDAVLREANLSATHSQVRDLPALTETALQRALGTQAERLLVTDRDGLPPDQEAALLRVAASRGTPVLLVGPEPEG